MTAANAFSQRPQPGPFDDEAHDSWSMPVVRVAGTQLHIAYSVFIALAVLTAFTVTVAPREGNSDLPIVTLIGVAFWVTGWCVQTVAALAIGIWLRCPSSTMTIGLWGVESSRRPWTAAQALALVAGTLVPVLLLGTAIIAADYVWYGHPSFQQSGSQSSWLGSWVNVWDTPSLGLTSADSILRTGAWLCFIQVLCQTLPFPTTLGRLGLVALVTVTQPDSDPRVQTRRSRFAIRVIAVTMATTAAALLLIDGAVLPMQWPLLLLLAVVLWLTAQAKDISSYVSSFHELSDEQILQWLDSEGPLADDGLVKLAPRETLLARVTGFAKNWNNRRKALRALQREHAEADDVLRLDEVLERIHTDGKESLSEKDRALLMRVSRTMQKQRTDSTHGSTE